MNWPLVYRTLNIIDPDRDQGGVDGYLSKSHKAHQGN